MPLLVEAAVTAGLSTRVENVSTKPARGAIIQNYMAELVSRRPERNMAAVTQVFMKMGCVKEMPATLARPQKCMTAENVWAM